MTEQPILIDQQPTPFARDLHRQFEAMKQAVEHSNRCFSHEPTRDAAIAAFTEEAR
jgi:hypothetical protein